MSWGADRLLRPAGLKPKAVEGKALLGAPSNRHMETAIEILAGSGINALQCQNLAHGESPGIRQVHSSCKDWMTDPTTTSHGVTYGFARARPMKTAMTWCQETLVRKLLTALGELGEIRAMIAKYKKNILVRRLT